MNRNFGIVLLIFCFGLSNINLGRAAGVIQAVPVDIQQVDLGEINMQMLAQDRINREQELVISGLIDDNQKLAAKALAQNQDATLAKINQTMIEYRNSLLSRDQTRVVTDAQRASKYYDLITLTEDVDDMKSARQTLQLRWDVIYGKHKMLTELEEELTALNEKLKGQAPREIVNVSDSQQGSNIQSLTQRLAEADQKISHYDEIISQKDRVIAQLTDNLAKTQNFAAAKDEMIKQKNDQVDLLKSELEDKISQEKNQVPMRSSNKDQIIKEKQDQVVDLQRSVPVNMIAQVPNQDQKDMIIKNQEGQIAQISAKLQEQADENTQVTAKLKEQADTFADEKNQVMVLRDKIQQQFTDEKAKDESIRWLNQVLSVAKEKAAYYQLISQQDKTSMAEVQGEVRKIRGDFAQRFKDYDQFENAITSLKNKVSRLNWQLSDVKDKGQQDQQLREGLKVQLQEKQAEIVTMKADILAITQDRANKENYFHNAAIQMDDRVKLAKQLIDLQQQEASLLEEKSDLESTQNTNFEDRFTVFESKINGLLADRQLQTAGMKNRIEELKDELGQKQEQLAALKTELNAKIAEVKDHDMLIGQVQGLRAQLQDKEAQIAATNSQSDQTTAMMGEYQKKLEAKGNAFNDELKQVLDAKNKRALLEAQIVDLNVKLQEKETQIVNLKKDMYDLKEMNNTRDKDAQASELNLSMVQQKAVEKKIDEYQAQINMMRAANAKQVHEIAKLNFELELVRKKLADRVPNSDEIEYFKSGFNKAVLQLKQKDALILQVKANAQEYEKEYKAQSREFQSLKDQLQDAQDEIGRRDEDLKYKNMEITRLKSHTKMSGSDLQKQVMILTQKLEDAQKKLSRKTHEGRIEALQAQLVSAKAEIKDLHKQLDQFIMPSKNNPLEEKLKQALDKIDQQGKAINALVQKLQDCGKSVNLDKLGDKDNQ